MYDADEHVYELMGEIERLKAENECLREALCDMLESTSCPTLSTYRMRQIRALAVGATFEED